jgi:hypothetical protein
MYRLKVLKPTRIGKDGSKRGILTEGAVYIEGDVVEVTRFEAQELMRVAPGCFEPANAQARALLAPESEKDDRSRR